MTKIIWEMRGRGLAAILTYTNGETSYTLTCGRVGYSYTEQRVTSTMEGAILADKWMAEMRKAQEE